ncbi:MAG: ATP-binding cassette domain-containing protein [Verrucomicrobia bacterium]|nr:ATP-binding cassette domain-containing protein [Verrucomicrobiota bacterium]MDA1204415.1 ATP-binding cassette domain-containing protein [Verrucomicrobiota bacterium]
MSATETPTGAGLGRRLEGTLRNFYRARRAGESLFRRAMRRPRTVTESPNLLPLLIKVLAGFARVDGDLLEEEIDSSLGFLRYDYPEAVYSELRQHFRQALHEKQDLGAMARQLRNQLGEDRKILLGIQLYDLVHRSGMNTDNMAAYYSFMEQLGTASQAIDIVYQLNSDMPDPRGEFFAAESSPLEVIIFGSDAAADVRMQELTGTNRLAVYRHGDLILVKNLCNHPVSVQGRALRSREFSRVYPGQRIVVDEKVLTHQDLVFYFNAKKNLSLAHIFISVTKDNEIQLEKSRTRDSSLEVRFGLSVLVIALKDVPATLDGVRLRANARVEATLEGKIRFDNDTELSLDDLRRHAHSYGGRFHLKHSKTTYLVSNNPALLDEDDILLAPGAGGDVLLRIFCDFDRLLGRLEVLKTDQPIMVGDTPVRNEADLRDGDMIQIDSNQSLRCNFSERLLEEERNVIHHLDVRDLVCRFQGGGLGIDGVSFAATRGEMICVMGASGCGKSSLLRSLAGQFPPVRGQVLFNGLSLYENFDALKQYVTYIPQFDAFDEHLTIGENLDFAAAIRSPYLSWRERRRRIDGKLAELGLNERRDSVVGATHKKTLSGGERKRLNIGLDMIGSADIYLFDEPTSGLSSKDSEHVMEIIRAMAHNKIVIVTIHQPSSKIFQMFNKAMLLDRGGRMVFFGTPHEMLSYFAEAEHQQHFGTPLGGCPACGTTRPEFVFDVLETPLRDLSGDIIYEENDRGQLVPVRRYSPDYWRDKYEAWRLMRDVRQPAPEPVPGDSQGVGAETRRSWRTALREEFLQFRTLLARAFISKLRNKGNLATTMIAAPALAALIGAVLRYSEEGTYDFASSFHIPTYLFLSLVVAMFLGLTNSVDDIIRDRPILQRERNLNVRLGWYILAKVLTLSLFALVQCVFFILIANWILEVRGMFWIFLAAMVLTAVSGIAIGLLISSLVSESKTAVNIIPVVLIPQIILGGALIKYEEMNQNLDFVYSVSRWFSENPEAGQPRSDLQVPLICEFMPMRWSYEAIVFAQAKLNPLTSRQEKIQAQINKLARSPNLTVPEEERLEDLKELLAMVSGLQGADTAAVERELRGIDRVLDGEPLPEVSAGSAPRGVSAERLFVNQKTADLVNKAEMEQSDYRETRFLNVFFGPEKRYFGLGGSVLVFNAWVLILSSLAMFQALYFVLRQQLKSQQL